MEAQPARSQVSVKTAFTVSMTVAGVAALVLAIVETRLAITITVAATLVAIALHHVVDLLVRHRVRRAIAIAIVLVALLGIIAGAVLLIVPPAVRQAEALISEAPKLFREARHSHIYELIHDRLGASWPFSGEGSSGALRGTAVPAIHALTGFLGGLAALATTFFLAVFMLIFGGQLIRAVIDETTAEHRRTYERVVRKIYKSVGGYLGGLAFICSVNATLTTVFLAIVRAPFFLPMGILSGFSSLVPYAGPITAGVSITLLTLATRGPWVALATVIYFILYGQLEGQILGPLVYRRTVDVNPLVTLLSIVFFVELAGVVGAVIAVPAAAAGQIILRELLAIRPERLHPS